VRGKLYDPLTNLTFGGALVGEGFVAGGTTEGEYAKTPFKGWRYKSRAPARRHRIEVFCHIAQTPAVEGWKQGLGKLVAAKNPTRDEARKRTLAWWDAFWQRSHIAINPSKPDPKDKAWQAGRNYQLFRYQLACNVSGREPTLFNGGLFTCDPMYTPGGGSGEGWTPDWRRWGAGLTAQNQRLVYWPMLRSGDFDAIVPGLDFYRLGLASSAARVKVYWGHEGCCCAEQISVLAPAANLGTRRCGEIPELYPVFPYDRYGLGGDDFEMAVETWKRTGGSKGHISWHQGSIFTARLAFADEAARFAILKLGDSGRRFPTFWGPGHDWVPDHNWGGSGMVGLQEMLVQSHGRRIWLLPAWPKDWDADFKLHAPYQTIVAGRVRDGRLVALEVTPELRRKDVVVSELK